MSDEALLTLRQLASELDLPESTVRYYRDAFLDHIPAIGSGRRRRYPREALDVLRTVASLYAAGHSRGEIIAAIHGGGDAGSGATVAVTAGKSVPVRPLEEVSNLDLLAAILDGEREQRDALWQMAKEIVRLTEVLESQDKVLSEIADRAGVTVPPRSPLISPQSSAESPAPAPPPPPPSPPPPPPPPPPDAPLSQGTAKPAFETMVFTPPPFHMPPGSTAEPSSEASEELAQPQGRQSATESVARRGPAGPASGIGASDDIAKLKAELEAERQLVERLREAKLQLERRAAEAEEAAHERRSRRGSVIRRILGGETE